MADYAVANGVAVITCQNPPVNQLSYRLRIGLFDGLHAALKDDTVKAIVIIGGGRTFPAGADVKEFATGEAFKKSIQEFITELDHSSKPTIAAIHGTALGGGLEIALACHYRIGTSRCKVGVPEVLIGLLPGAGGTQRLPRLIGSMLAAEMIASGQHVPAARAKKIGILDDVVNVLSNHQVSMEQYILRSAAIQYALNIANKPITNRIVSNKKAEPINEFFYNALRQQINRAARGHIAPEYCIQAVKAASECNTFDEGLKRERDLFMKLATGTQAPSLQHVFFAQRQITKIPGIDTKLAKKIKKVGIIGCGTMGGGILMNFVQQGIPVTVLEVKQQYLDKGLSVVQGNWMRQVKKGKLAKKKMEKYVSLITPTTKYEDLSDVDIVIEAVFENIGVKEKVFKELDRVCKPDCILASNTSFLDIQKIASFTSRPQQVIGTHFFAPANQMQLLENVRHSQNDNVTIATVQQMAKTIKKKGVLVRTCEGFVGNRMYAIEGTEATRLVLEGALPEQVDKVLKNFGYPMGIFAVSDLSGLDIGFRSRTDKGWVENPSLCPLGMEYYPFELPDLLVSKYERLGLKVGKGWYDYEPRKRKPIPSKFVTKLIEEMRAKKGITPRNISDEEILERCMYPMINEGFKILEEGIAVRPSDIDVVKVFGYGFPAYRGGPMFYADLIGLRKIRDMLVKYSNKYPNAPFFKPSALLNQLADSNTKLSKYWRKQEKKQAKL